LSLAKITDNADIEASLLSLARQLALRALELGAEWGSLPQIPELAKPDAPPS
jgi:hypothetical protein